MADDNAEEVDNPPEMIKLVSAEGDEFWVDKRAAMVSGTIKSMLTGPANFQENQQGEIKFMEISSNILEKVCQYFYFKLRYSNSTTGIPEFQIEPSIALDLLMASNFLDT